MGYPIVASAVRLRRQQGGAVLDVQPCSAVYASAGCCMPTCMYVLLPARNLVGCDVLMSCRLVRPSMCASQCGTRVRRRCATAAPGRQSPTLRSRSRRMSGGQAAAVAGAAAAARGAAGEEGVQRGCLQAAELLVQLQQSQWLAAVEACPAFSRGECRLLTAEVAAAYSC